MGLELILIGEIRPKLWDAKGFFEVPNGPKGDVDVLVEQLDEHTVRLKLDKSIKVSRMANREVLNYVNVKPEHVAPRVEAGAKVKIENKLWFNLKKQ